MLTQQLRALESDGLVARQIFPEVPPRVEYSVTDDGKALKPVFEAMHKWWLEQKR
jgi:DNA-binding HxlR family transcriptional regulator